MATQKYRLNNGDCRHCGSPENAYHLSRCPIVVIMEQHHELAHDTVFETMAQLDKWDIQNHPMGTGPEVRLLARTDINLDLRTGKELEHIFREETEARFKRGEGTYWDILMEEVFEAGAATGKELEEELVQVAAVALAMAAASKRARGA